MDDMRRKYGRVYAYRTIDIMTSRVQVRLYVLGPFYAIFFTLSIPNISDKNKLLEANSIEPTKEFLNSLPDCF